MEVTCQTIKDISLQLAVGLFAFVAVFNYCGQFVSLINDFEMSLSLHSKPLMKIYHCGIGLI